MNSPSELDHLDVKHEEDPLSVGKIKTEPQDLQTEKTTEVEECEKFPISEVEHIDIKPDPHFVASMFNRSEIQDTQETLDEPLDGQENSKQRGSNVPIVHVPHGTDLVEEKSVNPVCDHKEEIYSCNICNNSFPSYKTATGNECTRTADKLPRCNICGKSYSCKSHLAQHMRTHTGEKPFKCNICSKSFSNKSNLSVHERLHTGVKSFTCNICNKLFYTKAHLTRHISSVHTNHNPFTCTICDKTFYHKTNLIKHNALMHS